MAGNSVDGADSGQRLPNWLIGFCKRAWRRRRFFWSTIGLNAVLAVVVTWAFTNPATLQKLPISFLFQQPIIILVAFIVSLSVTGFVGIISLLPERNPLSVPESEKKPEEPVLDTNKELKRRYLQRMIRETEMLRLTGIPAGLVAQSVPLDYVFIPLQFLPRRLPSDYPLTAEEFRNYRERLKGGLFSEEMERVFFRAEKSWEGILKKGDKINIADLWQQLARDDPAAVIQGYPGMGKSTLMARLALHMARCGLGQPDSTMGRRLDPSYVPILLRLGDYAAECAKASAGSVDLSLSDYLKISSDRLHIPDLFPFLQKCLAGGRCLIMLDGLDEVSDPQMRKQVQEAIKTFILDHRDSSEISFNRFLVTSRVAGYDLMAFPDYSHYTIADLTSEQIENFLPRWCRASVRRDAASITSGQVEREEAIAREAEQMAQKLSMAVRDHQGVRKLAENPLLLTLLAVMQQNSIELPKQRVELYTVVTRTLLENRNIAKGLLPIPETQAIQRLGPIALQMQETGNSFARQREVMDSLKQTISVAGGTEEQITQEAENFLSRIRERGGLFVQRTGDYFGFFHRTFQEYFVARHVLNQIKGNSDHWISELVNSARRRDDLWREPFLLAVAYKSGEDETVARQIISTLLIASQDAGFENYVHSLLLAAECLIEAKPLTIGADLEKQIARHLLQTYEEAQRSRRFEVCERIESIMCRWLLSLPGEAYRPALLVVLSEAISDTRYIARQRATLTLLSMIAQQLVSCPFIVFDTFIPPLLTLTGLPAVGGYKLAADLSASTDLNVADLALTSLSFMGRRGPAGLQLAEVRQYFRDHPEHLRLLAQYSLESESLLTLAFVPLTEDNYQRYESAIGQWIALRDHHKTGRTTQQEIDICLNIHKALLDCAEEVCYPSARHLLNMLQAAANNPDQPWQQTWQNYLSGQLASSEYISYQEVALLWTTLFPGEEARKQLVSLLSEHYNSSGVFVQRYAQRFLATLSNDLRDLGDLRDLRYLSNLRYLRDLRNLRSLSYLSNLRDLKDLINLKYLSYLRYLIYLSYLLLTQEVTKKAIECLSPADVASIDQVEQIDLLTILLGRILQIQEAGETGEAIELELQQIAQVAYVGLTPTVNDEVREAMLDIVRYLPARSMNEIKMVLQLAEGSTDERIQRACAVALERSRPKTSDDWAVLELGEQSKVG